MTELVLEWLGERPWSLNDERAGHWSARADRTKRWRHAFAILARAEGRDVELEVPVVIEATPLGVRGDAGNHLPAVKAAVDGLIDAGLLDDDSPHYVVALVLRAPEPATPPGLRIAVRTAHPQ